MNLTSYDAVPKNTPVINSNEIAKEARIAGLLTVNAQDNREAMRLIEGQTKDLNSFAIERISKKQKPGGL